MKSYMYCLRPPNPGFIILLLFQNQRLELIKKKQPRFFKAFKQIDLLCPENSHIPRIYVSQCDPQNHKII